MHICITSMIHVRNKIENAETGNVNGQQTAQDHQWVFTTARKSH